MEQFWQWDDLEVIGYEEPDGVRAVHPLQLIPIYGVIAKDCVIRPAWISPEGVAAHERVLTYDEFRDGVRDARFGELSHRKPADPSKMLCKRREGEDARFCSLEEVEERLKEQFREIVSDCWGALHSIDIRRAGTSPVEEPDGLREARDVLESEKALGVVEWIEYGRDAANLLLALVNWCGAELSDGERRKEDLRTYDDISALLPRGGRKGSGQANVLELSSWCFEGLKVAESLVASAWALPVPHRIVSDLESEIDKRKEPTEQDEDLRKTIDLENGIKKRQEKKNRAVEKLQAAWEDPGQALEDRGAQEGRDQ